MNNRIRKKIYKRYLSSLVGDISVSSIWRQKLFNADYFAWYKLDYTSLINTPVFEKEALRRYNLIYQVAKIPPNEETEKIKLQFGKAFGTGKCEVVFLFRSSEYHNIYAYSWNNAEYI